MLCVVSLLDSYFFMLKHFIIGRFLFKRHFLDCFHYIYVPPSYRGAQGVMSFILMSNLSAVSSLPWIRKTIFFLFSPFLLPWGGIQVHIHFKWGKLSHSINSTNYFRIKDFFFSWYWMKIVFGLIFLLCQKTKFNFEWIQNYLEKNLASTDLRSWLFHICFW